MIDATHLAAVMEKDGTSPKQLADSIGVSVSYVCDILSGRRTLKRNPELIGKIAAHLNVPRSMIEHRVAVP